MRKGYGDGDGDGDGDGLTDYADHHPECGLFLEHKVKCPGNKIHGLRVADVRIPHCKGTQATTQRTDTRFGLVERMLLPTHGDGDGDGDWVRNGQTYRKCSF